MKTINEYLDDLKNKTGSDYASAKALKIGKSSLSMIRSRGQMADETAVKLAEILGIDNGEILIAASIARSDGEVKKAWEKISQGLGIAVSITLAIIITSEIDCNNINNLDFNKSFNNHDYAKLNR